MPQKTHSRSRAARLALLIAVPALVLTTACGGAESSDEGVASVSNAPSTDQTKDGAGSSKGGGAQGKSAFYDAQMKFVQCMRKKITKDYPAPKLSGHLDWTKINQLQEETGNDDIAKAGRAGACAPEMQKAMSLEPPRDTQKDYESMLAHAKCMRAHGVSKFTNPKLKDGNVLPGGDPKPASPELDQESSTYKQATQACKDKLLDGLDGMQ